MSVPSALGRTTPSAMPDVFNGEIYKSVGRYARGAVLFAFEQIGGADGLAAWADENRDEFYTKLFPKIITRESEVAHSHTVDQLMDVLDLPAGDVVVVGDDAPSTIPETHETVGVSWESHAVPMDDSDPAEVSGEDMVEFHE